jgi:N4-gp56 family major capsid protein
MAITNMANVPYFLPAYYDKKFLETLDAQPKAEAYCMTKPLPMNTGNVAYFPRMTSAANNPSSHKISTDGSVITPRAIVDEQVSATIVQFGDAAAISDMVEMTAISATDEETVRNLAVQAGNLLDKTILARAYSSCVSQVFTSVGSGDVTSVGASFGGFVLQYVDQAILSNTPATAIASCGNTGNAMTAAALRRGLKTLKGNNVQPLDQGFYAFLCHTSTAMKLLADTSIGELYKYTDPENLKKGIVGRYANAMIIEDNNVLVSGGGSSSANVYYSIMLGRGALGVTDLGNLRTYTEKSGGTSDPIHQFSTYGWKAQRAVAQLNSSAGLIIASNDD